MRGAALLRITTGLAAGLPAGLAFGLYGAITISVRPGAMAPGAVGTDEPWTTGSERND